MKKLSFIIAALLVCGTLFAQQPSKATLDCDAPENFSGQYEEMQNGTVYALLSWDNPVEGVWYHYDQEPVLGSVDISGLWGIKIPSDTLSHYLGCYITKIRFYKTGCTEHGGNINVNIFFGGETAPQTLVWYSHIEIEPGPDEWVEFNNIFIGDGIVENLPIWIMMETDSIPAAYCPTSGNPDGRWAGDYSSGYYDYYAQTGQGGDWLIQVFFDPLAKEDNDVDHFNIYRGVSLDAMERIAETNRFARFYWDDLANEPGDYYYRLTASYDDGCESAYALDVDNPENDFVHIFVTAVDEHEGNHVMLYPNPTNGLVRINGVKVAELQVCNLLGQLVKTDQNTNEIDLKGLPEGVYLLRITDEIGAVATRKIIVQ